MRIKFNDILDVAECVAFPVGGQWYQVHPELMREPRRLKLNNPQTIEWFKSHGYRICQGQGTCLAVVDPERPNLVAKC